MGIALFTAANLFSPLQEALAWLMPVSTRDAALRKTPSALPGHVPGHMPGFAGRRHAPPSLPTRWTAPSGAVATRPACAPRPQRPQQRPLRVTRFVERSLAPAGTGRLVISGRMADVCAELDRLAALEDAAEAQALLPTR